MKKTGLIALFLALCILLSITASAVSEDGTEQPVAGTGEPVQRATEADEPTGEPTEETTEPTEATEPTEPTEATEGTEPTEETAAPTEPEEIYDYPEDWSREALVFAVENRILNGDQHHNLNPHQNITRAEMAAILVRMLGAREAGDLSAYQDVSTDDWFYDELSAAVGAGIFKGVTDTAMEPNACLTREQAIVVLTRAFGIADTDSTAYSTFTDGETVSLYARYAVSALVRQNLISGYTDGSLRPQGEITRAEAAQLIYNMFTCIADAPEEIPAQGRVLYRGTAPLPDTLHLDGSLVIGQGAPGEISPVDWKITGTLAIRTGRDTRVQAAGISADTLVIAPLGGSAEATASRLFLGGDLEFSGNTSDLTILSGHVSVRGNMGKLTVRDGAALTTDQGADGEVFVGNGASLQLNGACRKLTTGQSARATVAGNMDVLTAGAGAVVQVEGRVQAVYFGRNADVTLGKDIDYLCLDKKNVHVTLKGKVRYVEVLAPGAVLNGEVTSGIQVGNNAGLYLNGSCRDVTMGESAALIVEKDARVITVGNHSNLHVKGRLEALYFGKNAEVRLDSDMDYLNIDKDQVHMTLNGQVRYIDISGADVTLDGAGYAGTVALTGGGLQCTLQYGQLNDRVTIKTCKIPCYSKYDVSMYEFQGGGGYIRTIPAGTVVYNEYWPSGNWMLVSMQDGTTGWVSRYEFFIDVDNADYDGSYDYSTSAKEYFVNRKQYESKTEYLLWINRYTQKVMFFQGSKGNWKLYKTAPCASGSNYTPTPSGIYEVYAKQDFWNFGSYGVFDVTLFVGEMAFHSYLIDWNGYVVDDTMGQPASHGCIRMLPEDAKYIHDNIPEKTTVVVY